jgi:hypothetical protein
MVRWLNLRAPSMLCFAQWKSSVAWRSAMRTFPNERIEIGAGINVGAIMIDEGDVYSDVVSP